MTIRLVIEGIQIECDSAEEAVSMLAASKAQLPKNGDNGATHYRQRVVPAAVHVTSKDDRLRAFVASLDPSSLTLLKVLWSNTDELRTEALAAAIGVKATDIKYALRRLQAAATRNKFNDGEFVQIEKRYVNRVGKSFYRMPKTMRAALSSCGIF